MSFFADLFTSIGALGVAFVAVDAIRHYAPNYYRVIFPAVALAAADAYVPQFSILAPGWIVGTILGTGILWYTLRGKRVVRQDGSIDNG